MAYVANVTVPAGKVAATLTGFVVRVDLSHMPAGWWISAGPDGANIRVRSAGTDLPFDLVSFDPAGKAGLLFFKANLSSASDNLFVVESVAGATAPAATDPIGRNAVWSDYDAVIMFAQMVDRTGKGHDPQIIGQAGTYPLLASKASPASVTDPGELQGVSIDAAGNFYLNTAQRIDRYDAAWNLQQSYTTPIADSGIAGINHLGDGTFVSGELYVVAEEYPSGPYTNQHVLVFGADLTFRRSYDISAQGHEVSGITYDSTDGNFYIAGYESADDPVLYRYDSAFNYLGTLNLAQSIPSKQGLAHSATDHAFYVVSGKSSFSSAIYKVTEDGATVTVAYGGLDNLQGIEAASDGSLYVVRRGDGVYRLTANPSTGPNGWLTLTGNGNAEVGGLSRRTTWTMGATGIVNPLGTANATLLSYGQQDISNSYRASLLLAGTAKQYALWNSSNGYMYDTSAIAAQGDRVRMHHVQNGTAYRKIYRQGALRATSGTVSQRPGGTVGSYLFVGAEDTSYLERWKGSINYVYLRDGELSADWISAEVASWETPSSFYTVTDGGGDVVTGDLAGTAPAVASSMAGTVTAPPVTGTLGGVAPGRSASVAATFAAAPVDATLTGTAPGRSGAIAGQVEGAVTGTLTGAAPGRSGDFAGASDGPASVVVETDTTYANHGYNYTGVGEVTYDPPIAPTPARIRRAKVMRVHQSIATPTLVDGRPV